MKILQLVTKRQYRGAEVFAANLSKELVKEGVDVVFAGLYKTDQNPLSVDGARNVDLNGNKTFLSWDTIKKLKRLVEEEKPDVVQANGSDTLKYAVALRLFYPTMPIVYRNISIISTWVGRSSLKLLFYKMIFAQVNHVSSVGQEAVEDLIRLFSYPPEKTSVIRRGIPVIDIPKNSLRVKLSETFDFPDNSKIVMHVGNFSPEKNHSFLLEVFNLIKEVDESIKLVLIGEGPLYSKIKNDVSDKGLESTVFFLGFQKDVQSYLAAADLFIMGSTVEGVPGVVLEAAAQYVPTVAVDVGGVKEVIIPGVTGILLPNHNAANFANHVVELVSNKRKLKELGENAHRLVVSSFDPEKNCMRFISLYNSLSENKIKIRKGVLL